MLYSYYPTHDDICPVCGATVDDVSRITCSNRCAVLNESGTTIPFIRGLYDLLCNIYGEPADPNNAMPFFQKYVYKSTNCGAWIECLAYDTIRIGSIVEGTDICATPHTLTYPFTMDEYFSAMQKIEDECDAIFEEYCLSEDE